MSVGEIIALVSAIAGPLASVVCVVINNRNTKRQMLETEARIREENDKKQDEILMMTLRNSIKMTYQSGKLNKLLEKTLWEGACAEYDKYKALGGNSYVHDLMEQMQTWDKY